MAITSVTSLLDNGSSTDASSYTTGSVSPAANAVLFLFISNGHASAATAPSSFGGTLGLTWTLVVSDTPSVTTMRGSWYRAVTGASPPSGTVQINFGSTHSSCQWHFTQVLGADLTTPVVQSDSLPSTTADNPAIALAALQSGSVTLGAYVSNITTAHAPGSGYTTLSDSPSATSPAIISSVEYKNPGSSTVGWTLTSNVVKCLFAIEVAEGPPPAQTVGPTGIASAEAVGSAVLNPVIDVAPSAIASAEAVGSPSLTPRIDLAPAAIASAEAVGTPVLAPRITVAPEAIRSSSGAVNYFTDPSFEAGISQMISPVGCTLSHDTTEGKFGTKSLKYTATTNDLGYYSYFSGAPASAGEQWVGGFWVKPPRTIYAQAFIAAYSGGSLLTQQGGNVLALANVWTWIESLPLTMPATTDTVSIVPVINATNVLAGEVSYIDGVVLEKAAAVNMRDDPFSWMGTPALSQTDPSQIISPSAIGSAEALGSPVLSPRVTVAPTAIGSLQAFGAPILTPRITIAPTGLDDGGSIPGTPALTLRITLQPNAIASAEAFGAPVLTPRVTLAPSSIASLEGVGTPSLSLRIVLTPTGIASAEGLGSPVLAPRITIIPNAISSAEALGTPVLSPRIVLTPTAIASLEALGNPVLSPRVTVTPNGIDETAILGTPSLGGTNTLGPTGIASQEGVGAPVVVPRVTVTPTGIASLEGLGAPVLSPRITLTPTGIVTAQAMGTPVLAPRVTVGPVSIADFIDQFDNLDNWVTSSGTPSIVNGQLELDVTSAYEIVDSIMSFDFTGSSAAIKVAQVTGAGTTETGLNVMKNPDPNSNMWSILVVGGNMLYTRERVNGSYDDTNMAYDPVTMKYLRIREASGTIYWETSPDGVVWTVRRSKAAGFTYTTVKIRLYAGRWTGVGSGTGILDDLTVFSPSVVNQVGTPVITTKIVLTPTGVVSAQAFGAVVITTKITLSPNGIATAEALGNPILLTTSLEFEGWGIPL